MSTGLKINWYPVQVPNTPLVVDAHVVDERQDARSISEIRQYQLSDRFLRVNMCPNVQSPILGSYEVGCDELPHLTSSLITMALLNHFKGARFSTEPGFGESSAYREKKVGGLPPSIRFYEGLRLKPFWIRSEKHILFGVVIDYKTRQEFSTPLVDDQTQIQLAMAGRDVLVADNSNFIRSASLISLSGDKATINIRGNEVTVDSASIKLAANFQTIIDYFDRTDRSQTRQIVKTLQVQSYSLVGPGTQNIRRLADRYKAVTLLIEGDRRANISLKLGTLCQSIASLATAPADVDLRFT